MKLLFDQNLSPKLVTRLSDVYPDSIHVQSAGLALASDDQIWDFAKSNGLAIVTKDEDYNDLSVLRGTPPKIVWLQLGNCTTAHVESVLRTRLADILAFEADGAVATLVLT